MSSKSRLLLVLHTVATVHRGSLTPGSFWNFAQTSLAEELCNFCKKDRGSGILLSSRTFCCKGWKSPKRSNTPFARATRGQIYCPVLFSVDSSLSLIESVSFPWRCLSTAWSFQRSTHCLHHYRAQSGLRMKTVSYTRLSASCPHTPNLHLARSLVVKCSPKLSLATPL